MREKDYPVEVVELKGTLHRLIPHDILNEINIFPYRHCHGLFLGTKRRTLCHRISNDPNLGNQGPGVTIKTDVSFYQLDHGKNDFRLLRMLKRLME